MTCTSVPSPLNFIAFANVRRTSASTSSDMTYFPPSSINFFIVPKSICFGHSISLYVGKPSASGSTGEARREAPLVCDQLSDRCQALFVHHLQQTPVSKRVESDLRVRFAREFLRTDGRHLRDTEDAFLLVSIAFTSAFARCG